MWWPSPEALTDLVVEDTEHGFELFAPDGTECAEWLSFWNQDETHHKVFEEQFVNMLTEYVNKTLEEHGKTETIFDEQSNY
jgi:hypothetical protein